MITYKIHNENCIEVLKDMQENSVDSIVTDPPYGLSFMGKRWDYDVPSTDIWAECLRVLKPGGHLLAFAGTRTQHRMAVRIEDAGFEIRDMIAWVYGSGFPKSMDVSKAIDKAAGAERELTRPGVVRREGYGGNWDKGDSSTRPRYDVPATATAEQWQGWGTALKPALEPITVARKPLIGTVAANVLEHGTGALNIDGCRVGWPDGKVPEIGTPGWGGPAKKLTAVPGQEGETVERSQPNSAGRWPANLIHDGSEEVLSAFPQASGAVAPVKGTEASAKTANAFGEYSGRAQSDQRDGGGSAARFFYCAKASKRDRNEGCGHIESKQYSHDGRETPIDNAYQRNSSNSSNSSNSHPTVKPTDLMAYLCRLVTPPGGVVLDPFMGSGSTGKAAMREGFRFIGCELNKEYFEIAESRIKYEKEKLDNAEKSSKADLFQQSFSI